MRVVEAFPRPVRQIENCWIPMRDGCRLAARIWLPEDADASPVPAILEYIPYRKRDFTRPRDEPMHHYFAGHGYAAVRLDVRGSGESDGVLLDEYLEQELDDGVEAIAWLAAQPWCTGAVGMMGKSWGGFNALQVAARRPPALGAIVTVCSTDDRWADDAHYMGGCLLNENLTWGAALLTYAVQPPDPALVGDRWRAMWRERLDGVPLHVETWLRHQRRDDYWRRGSVCEDFGRIACPVYAVGGWADAYTNAIPRLLAGLSCPRKGLVGPWGHLYPHNGVPGPAIGFLQEALRWWDQWLKGADTGITDEPMYRVWMQESVPPRDFYAVRPGRWVAEPAWPSPRVAARRWALAPGGLVESAAPETRVEGRSPETVGLAAGDWCGFGAEGEAPADQREDDARSLAFDSAPLPARLEILGAPVATLEVAVDRPLALLAVRLVDVAPDGAATRVTYGVLNLMHRESHERPEPCAPGRRVRVRVALNDVAYAFPAGHRLRLAVSTAYWPVVWPAPAPVVLGVFTGTSTLELPVRPPRPEDVALPPFEGPAIAPPLEQTELRPGGFRRTIERDAASGETVYTTVADAGAFNTAAPARVNAIDLAVRHVTRRRYRIRDGDPLSAEAEVVQRTELGRGPWATATEVRARLTATADRFVLDVTLEAWEGSTPAAARRWQRTVPRDHV